VLLRVWVGCSVVHVWPKSDGGSGEGSQSRIVSSSSDSP
jgi:hypothetical protein